MGLPDFIKNTRLYHFLTRDIWRIRLRDLSSWKYFLVRTLRITLLSFRCFGATNCTLRASALTFYSLLSVVPVAALAFAISQGFGLRQNLEELLIERLQGQEDVARWIIQFADALLSEAKTGVVTGVGILLLFWAAIRLLNNVEQAFNDIWNLRAGRSFFRKLSDYTAIMFIAPVLFIISSSLNVFITSQMEIILQRMWLLGKLNFVTVFLVHLSPFVFLWILFAFMYLIMPNVWVSIRGGILAGIIGGTLFLLVQKAYIYSQVGVAKYNAVYGSLAALPLFIVWVNLGWQVVLLGAEVSFAYDNEEQYEYEPQSHNASLHFKRLLALRIGALCAKAFSRGERPLEAKLISQTLDAPIRLVRRILNELVEAHVLNRVKENNTKKDCYQPARSIDSLTIKEVLDQLDRHGNEHIPLAEDEDLKKLEEHLAALDHLIRSSPENVLLKDL